MAVDGFLSTAKIKGFRCVLTLDKSNWARAKPRALPHSRLDLLSGADLTLGMLASQAADFIFQQGQ